MLRKEQFRSSAQFDDPRIRSLLEAALSGIVLCPGIQVSITMSGRVSLHRLCHQDNEWGRDEQAIVLYDNGADMVNGFMHLISRCYKGYIRGTYIRETFISYTGRTFKFPDEQ